MDKYGKCTDRHTGKKNRANRAPLDHVIRDLPKGQAGFPGRCAYCAYEKGRDDALQAIRDCMDSLTPQSQAIVKDIQGIVEEDNEEDILKSAFAAAKGFFS